MRLRSLRNKLALVFFGVVFLAFGLVFFLVVPQLRTTLEDQQFDELARSAGATSAQLRAAQTQEIPADELNELVRAVADSANAQVTLLGVQRSEGNEPLFYSISDSRAQRLEELPSGPAARALATDSQVREVNSFGGSEAAQVAQPLSSDGSWVAVYSRSLESVSDTVSVIRRQILAAGGVALLVALAGSFLVARRLAGRVQRLERAAEEMAAGRFVTVPVDSPDEIGQLTQTFNEMQGQLARVDAARREFIANASHELRTPIFSLAGFLELLRDEELDSETQEEFLAATSEQVERLQKLATDLLDLSRLDAGSLEVVREPVDLAELARSVAREFTGVLEAHDSQLGLDLSERVEAFCDPDRVAQIMRILLDNALRHTPPGTAVRLSTGRANGAAHVAVTDSGPGLAEEARLHAFERFYTADGASGSGLGLAIARELAERMDGRVTLSSRPGRTTFSLELPASAA